jgi:hypothetical protein
LEFDQHTFENKSQEKVRLLVLTVDEGANCLEDSAESIGRGVGDLHDI